MSRELAEERQWHRFARLRDRAAGDPETLERVRAVLAPVEHELWAVADDVYTSGRRGALEACVAAAYASVDIALDRLGV